MGDNQHTVTRCASLAELSQAAAAYFADQAAAAIAQRGRCAVALTGGSTPRPLYELLATPEWRARVDWTRCELFWGDERAVPPDHPDSNFKLANDALLTHLSLRSDQIHRVPTEIGVAAAAARAYAASIAAFFGVTPPTWPRFDLVLLGMGSDGHVASLFPGFPTLDIRGEYATWSAPGTLPPRVDRVTLTLPVLNAARAVAFLVAGAEKAPALRRALAGDPGVPAGRVRPRDGELYWFVDEAATPFLAPGGATV